MKHVAKNQKTVALCASASFYKELLAIEKELKEAGFNVLVPYTAKEMQRTGNFEVDSYKTWYHDPVAYKRKSFLMRNHFKKIVRSDAILVVNFRKHNVEGYIGGNVLMEMAIAFHLRKRIFIFNEVLAQSSFHEEIMGMQPIFIQGNLDLHLFNIEEA